MSAYPSNIIQAFKAHFGEEPKMIVRAPGRINLIGEHTDYNQGFVMPAAIQQSMWFAISLRTDLNFDWHAHDLQQDFMGSASDIRKQDNQWINYLLGVVDQLQKAGHVIPGFNLVFGGDIPTGSGLSSSAALESGLAFALNALLDLEISRPELALLAQRAENEFVGMNCGIMDMYASLMGKEEQIMRLDCRSMERKFYPLDWPDHTLMLVNSGVKHKLIESGYNNRRDQCETAVKMLRQFQPDIKSLRNVSLELLLAHRSDIPPTIFKRCYFILSENARVHKTCEALEKDEINTIGDLLYQSHEGLQNEYEVSCPEMDFLVDLTRSLPYVLGSRMMGGGFGGCTINIVERSRMGDFIKYIKENYSANWKIDPTCIEVKIGNGTEIVEL
ncbi:MAG: galactokinase [Saprospiraceae bacterium]